MKISGMSDLARLQVLKGRAVDTRALLDKAARELTTNQKSSRYEATGGNLTRLFALERSIDRNAVFSENVALTELRLDVMQESLGRILTPVEALAVDLTTSVNLGDRSAAEIHAATARGTFEAAVGALNTAVAGQSLFAGTGTDGAALAPAAAILADLDALAAAAPDAAGVIAAVEGYFEKGPPPGAFYTTGYIGSVDDMSAVEIGEGQRLDYALRADADEIVAVLEALALAAVVDGGALAGVPGDRMTLLGESGARLLARKEGLMDLRAVIGIDQETVERARAERIGERDTLELARAKLIGVDPLEAASNYQALQVQLESIYTVTARIADLRFANFIR